MKNIWIIATMYSSLPEARAILQHIPNGKLVLFRKGRWELPSIPPDLMVRWGCTVPIHIKAPQLNSIDAIFKCVNKPITRLVLQNKGIPIPKTWMNNQDAEFPCIVRTERHWCGKNFLFADSKNDLEKIDFDGPHYFQEYYPNEQEYRIHVMSGKVTVIARKYAKEGEIRRNRGITQHAQDILEDIDDEIKQLAIDAVAAVGMDFGAVDIMSSKQHPHKAVVCEINTDPGLLLNNYCAPIYARYFMEQADCLASN